MTIYTMQFADTFWRETAALARGCSFQGSGAFLADCVEDDDFSGDDRVFAAVVKDKPIGFCTFTEENLDGDYPYAPWLDFVFVSEEHRGKGIAKMLVEAVCRYAKGQGFSKLYLLTASHAALYQKLGFTFLSECTVSGNTIASVMCRELTNS